MLYGRELTPSRRLVTFKTSFATVVTTKYRLFSYDAFKRRCFKNTLEELPKNKRILTQVLLNDVVVDDVD